jgi:chromosome segregation ATPase
MALQEFLDGNGDPVEGCKLTLSLTDFICATEAAELDFEDVRLEILSEKLHELFKHAFQKQIMTETREEIKEVRKRVDDTSNKMLSIEKMIQERSTTGVRGRAVKRKKESAEVKNTITEAEAEIGKIRRTVESMEKKMDKIGNRIVVTKVVEKGRVEIASRVAELIKRLGNVRAEEERRVEATRKSIRSRVHSAWRL